ncbi:TetR/AcrR family transcriptional regulator [Acidicapsa dinghuensis]|uniref:TetR/AcrR family transcriptional regulator n=1 Tax=Acidicapsa dinghuensis TaxID=2218256 RepID=A0ABW1EL35_9BACT|nr:TetR/AcrR family transcriptional regulator [Acidicapsa dinghuensis]
MARPRSQDAHEKVLRAAMELFAERGIEATSMDSISQASGVSKATIYNHWVNKEALLIEVMLYLNGLDRECTEVDTGDLCNDVAFILSRRPPDQFDSTRDRIMPSLIAYSALHPEFGEAWRHRVMERPRESLRKILRKGIQRGIFSANLNLEHSMALLLGPTLYMHIFHRNNYSKTEDIGPEIASAFWRAFSVENTPPSPKPRRSRSTPAAARP